MSEDERISAFIDGMLAGKAPREEDEDLAAIACGIWAESEWQRLRKEKKAAADIPLPADNAGKDALEDVIMECAPACEELDLSTVRVGKAARVIGFRRLNAFSAWCTYRIFPQLGRKYDFNKVREKVLVKNGFGRK